MKLLFTLFIVSLSLNIHAQKDSTRNTQKNHSWKFEKERIFFGGGVGGSIGSVTAINVSPIIGYRFTDKLLIGPRVIYNYYSLRGFGSFSNYGYGMVGRYFPRSKFFIQSEFQQLFVKINNSSRYSSPAFLVGAGYYNRPLIVSALYDLLWTARSPQNGPLQINFGLLF